LRFPPQTPQEIEREKPPSRPPGAVNADMTTPAERDQMRHRIHARPTMVPDELLPVGLCANPATKTITAQDVIQKAAEILA